MPTPLYHFDSTGDLPANKIINEEVIVTEANGINAYLIVPIAGPFFKKGFSIVNTAGITLTENTDYYFTHFWTEASISIGHDIFGTITLLNGYPIGTYRLNYQTIGGEYVVAKANVIQNGLAATNGEYLDIDWSTAPAVFPPMPHTHDLTELNGISSLFSGLHGIAEAIRAPTAGLHIDDIQDADTNYAISVVKPILEIMETIGLNNKADASVIAPFIAARYADKALAQTPGKLQHYTIPLPGNFFLKVGWVTFDKGDEPAVIHWAGPAFKVKCHFAMCKMSFLNYATDLCNDEVRTGPPTKTGVKIRVDYDPANITGARLIQYIAIGR